MRHSRVGGDPGLAAERVPLPMGGQHSARVSAGLLVFVRSRASAVASWTRSLVA
jgi:hypothetical protein